VVLPLPYIWGERRHLVSIFVLAISYTFSGIRLDVWYK